MSDEMIKRDKEIDLLHKKISRDMCVRFLTTLEGEKDSAAVSNIPECSSHILHQILGSFVPPRMYDPHLHNHNTQTPNLDTRPTFPSTLTQPTSRSSRSSVLCRMCGSAMAHVGSSFGSLCLTWGRW